MGILFVLMIDVDENDAVVGNFTAGAAVFQLSCLFTAMLAPVIDQPVVASSHILFQSTVMDAMHPPVGIAGIFQKPSDHLLYALMAGRVVAADPVQFCGEMLGRMIEEF